MLGAIRFYGPAACLTYRKWTIIVAISLITLASVSIVLLIIMMIISTASTKETHGFVLFFLIVPLAIFITFSVLLLLGAKQERTGFLLAWLIFNIAMLIFAILSFLGAIINCIKTPGNCWVHITSSVVSIVLYCLIFVLVNTLREIILNGESDDDD